MNRTRVIWTALVVCGAAVPLAYLGWITWRYGRVYTVTPREVMRTTEWHLKPFVIYTGDEIRAGVVSSLFPVDKRKQYIAVNEGEIVLAELTLGGLPCLGHMSGRDELFIYVHPLPDPTYRIYEFAERVRCDFYKCVTKSR